MNQHYRHQEEAETERLVGVAADQLSAMRENWDRFTLTTSRMGFATRHALTRLDELLDDMEKTLPIIRMKAADLRRAIAELDEREDA